MNLYPLTPQPSFSCSQVLPVLPSRLPDLDFMAHASPNRSLGPLHPSLSVHLLA